MMRHIPSGLFYRPYRTVKSPEGYFVKSNLSKKGKVYSMRPSLGWIGMSFYTHLHKHNYNVAHAFYPGEWEIVDIESDEPQRPYLCLLVVVDDYHDIEAFANSLRPECFYRELGTTFSDIVHPQLAYVGLIYSGPEEPSQEVIDKLLEKEGIELE